LQSLCRWLFGVDSRGVIRFDPSAEVISRAGGGRMKTLKSQRYVLTAIAALMIVGCRTAAPPIRFAPLGTDTARLRRDFPLSDAERLALTPDGFRRLTQDQVDQIYNRLSSGTIPDGPFRGDLFFPRDRDGNAHIRDLADTSLPLLANVAALRAEDAGRMFWRGKVLFRSQGLVRNRIEDLAILKPIVTDAATVPKLTFDGQTTWLLFPATLSCGASRFDTARRSILIDYSKTAELPGYRQVPDRLAGPEGLNIFDEIRIVRPGLYLGRSYFGSRFALNFTLLDPTQTSSPSPSTGTTEECAI
jgi:hypothetical protein